MKEKSLFLLCECGLSINTVRKLKMLDCTINNLLEDIEDLTILKNSSIQSPKKIKRALKLVQGLEKLESMYELTEFGLTEPIIKSLLDNKIDTLEKFSNVSEEKLIKLKFHKNIILKILDAKKKFQKKEYVIYNENINVFEKKPEDYIRVNEYIKSLDKTDTKNQIILEILNGDNVKNVAEKFQYTKQGILTLLKRELKKAILYEDKYYSYIFRKYKWDKSEFCEIFGESNLIFYYLKYKYKIFDKECKNYNELLNNDKISNELKLKIGKYINEQE